MSLSSVPFRPAPLPRPVLLGHGAALAWSGLWVLAGLRGGDAEWGGIVAGTGGLMSLLVVVAGLRSARAWLLLQLFTVILLVCCIVALATDPGGPGGGPGARAGDESTAFVLATVIAQGVSLLALNRRPARLWHQVDPQGWRGLFYR